MNNISYIKQQDSIIEEYISSNDKIAAKKTLAFQYFNNDLKATDEYIRNNLDSNNQSLSIEGAREIKTRLNKINGLEIMGPVDSPLLKIKKKFRSRLLIKFNEKSLKQKMVSNLLNTLKISSKIKLTVDVDPVNFG